MKDNQPYLFGIESDPTETIDKSTEEGDVLVDLIENYDRWNNEMPPAKYESTGIAFEKQSLALEALSAIRNK